MYVELRSPNIHEPASMTEYNNTIVNYRGTTPFLWAGGTEIMSEPDFYPALRGNMGNSTFNHFQQCLLNTFT